MTVLLVHGGLYEPMDAERFWRTPGIVAGLEAAGFHVLAPDRLDRPTSWQEEAAFLAAGLTTPHAVIAGSNGCSTALRLALDHPALVSRLLLCWPATAGDPAVDARARRSLENSGVDRPVIEQLLSGEIIRGVADAELAAVTIPVAVVPSDPHNAQHQRHTVDALHSSLRNCTVTPAFPESPLPQFAAHRDAFVRLLVHLLDGSAGASPPGRLSDISAP